MKHFFFTMKVCQKHPFKYCPNFVPTVSANTQLLEAQQDASRTPLLSGNHGIGSCLHCYQPCGHHSTCSDSIPCGKPARWFCLHWCRHGMPLCILILYLLVRVSMGSTGHCLSLGWTYVLIYVGLYQSYMCTVSLMPYFEEQHEDLNMYHYKPLG